MIEATVFYDAEHNLVRIGDSVIYVAGGSQYSYLRRGVVERILKQPHAYNTSYEIHIHFAPAEKGKPGIAKTTHPERILKYGLDGE